MTLFDTTDAASDLRARRAGHLPVPTKSRYMPLRAGVVNVWEYDDQQFWFGDGRLLLRGRNEAGKSKVLELLFPFVLDGDITPKKLDPFDTANKSMWWNLIGFHSERRSEIGYLWIEFGRLDDAGEPEYQTAIVGAQATRSERKVVTWFGLTPQRVDLDLDLAPGDVCRTQDSFAKALSADARFETRASAHRANVAARLFSMTPERYDNLLHLLRQLRKPKLADKLDPKKLSGILTDALPPLDDARIEPLAVGFGFLDADVEALAHTEAAHRATGAFLDTYRSYARAHARQRAAEVTRTNTVFDNVTREEKANEAALANARTATIELTKDAGTVARDLATASGSLQGLDLSAVESLRSLEQVANADAHLVATLSAELDRARERLEREEATASEQDDLVANETAALDDAIARARRTADRAGLPGEWDDNDDREASGESLVVAAQQRRGLLDAVESTDARAAKQRKKIDDAQQRVADRDAAHRDAADLRARASADAEAAATDLAQKVDAWAQSGPIPLSSADGDTVVAELSEHAGDPDARARTIATGLTTEITETVERDATAAAVAHAAAEGAHRSALDELAAHDAMPADVPPPARPGVPAERSGVPLWFAVDFAQGVTDDEAAMLEAALDASGLLTAAVTAAGLVGESEDTVIVPAATSPNAERTIAQWLTPAGGADADLVRAALAGIGAGPGSGLSCWVDVDGSWTNGPMTGRWSKIVAEHIGAGARAAARARRRQELAQTVERLGRELETAEAQLDAARTRQRDVADWVRTFPSITPWAAALQALSSAERTEGKAEQELGAARHHLETVRAEGAEVLAALDAAVTAARCRPEDVPEARRHASDARDAGRDLASTAKAHARIVDTARRARDAAERARIEHDAGAERLQAAEVTAAASKGAYDTAVELEGAEVEAILAEKDRLERAVDSLRTRSDEITRELRDARETEIRAEGALAETAVRREAASEERDSALAALADVVRTGHVGLVVALDVDRDPADYMQVFAGRNLARQITNAVPEADASEQARSATQDRLVRDFNALRSEIGTDFDPHLDTISNLFVASATLNGELIGIAELHRALADDVEQRRAAIATSERALIEQHLRDEVGNHLGDRLHAARTQVQQMNKILRNHPTNSGATVQLQWQVDDNAGPGVRDAIAAADFARYPRRSRLGRARIVPSRTRRPRPARRC